jgi:hypothetical protein
VAYLWCWSLGPERHVIAAPLLAVWSHDADSGASISANLEIDLTSEWPEAGLE